MMMNEPGFISSWAGASANGVTTAFINYQLRAKSLMHCLSLAEAKVLLISTSPAIISVCCCAYCLCVDNTADFMGVLVFRLLFCY